MIIISIDSKPESIYTSGGQDSHLGIDNYIVHFSEDGVDLELNSEQATELCKKLKQHLEAGKTY
jgi:hypothetical protein